MHGASSRKEPSQDGWCWLPSSPTAASWVAERGDGADVVVTNEPIVVRRPLPADVRRGRRWSMLLRAPRFALPPGRVPSVAPWVVVVRGGGLVPHASEGVAGRQLMRLRTHRCSGRGLAEPPLLGSAWL
ncbi:uncharacterized protein LOC123399620 [Hordeum vulgare subsp. vulgare]|uniref:uncharacterized protein LOC123399620 n=1 Tax=Hordeum vulgare subsp. vulgare TaxID=112509 RepID=UPI001D1A58F3|nr:uncharacterized protein LOC123399620 [Hordeum vulgare subsp. vulgare]